MQRSTISVLLTICVLAASGSASSQQVRPGSVVRINPSGSLGEPAPAQTDKAFQPERGKATGKQAENGCACSSANRCFFSLDSNYCIGSDGRRVFIQRYWGQ